MRAKKEAKTGDDWRYNPFIPQNGYGEICVNLALHWDLGARIDTEERYGREQNDA